MIVAEMTRRAKENLDTLADPERFVQQWMTMSGKGLEAFQGFIGAAMSAAGSPSGAAGAAKKK